MRLVVAPGGALGLRGAIIDGRQEYLHAARRSSVEAAKASIRYYLAAKLGSPADALDLADLHLVAFPRSRSLGWTASVEDGIRHVATVVVEADPDPQAEHPRLLYFNLDLAEALDEPVDIAVLAEDPGSDVLSAPVTATTQDSLIDATPLRGSQAGDAVALADGRIVAYNAAGATDQNTLYEETTPYSSIGASFQEPIGTDGFDVQSTYVAAQNMYAWTDRFMSGRWESLLGAKSSYAPGDFSPRLIILENVEYEGCESQSFCVNPAAVKGLAGEIPEAYQQPLGGPTFESLAFMTLEQAAHGPDTIGHEFGHFIDLFSNLGLIDSGLTCENCIPKCEPDTTDEASALKESFANFASLWYLRDLYVAGQSPTDCSVVRAVSRGMNDVPHAEGCLDEGNQVALFRPSKDCPAGFDCDALQADDSSPDTGICRTSAGYRIDSFHQALWESLHAQSCSTDPPYECVPRPALNAEPAGDLIGGALVFALRVDTATYRGFADDMATHIACNHGESAYEAFNEVLCHHAIRDCGAPTPVVCQTCGNGVAEVAEECDGNDLAGQTCVKLGFSGGTLMCDADCALDESQCASDIPTTGFDSDVPTTTAPQTDPPGESDESGLGEESAEEGCHCASGRARPPWAFLLGGILLIGRRRGWGLLAVLLAAGCTAESPQDEDTSGTGQTTVSASSTDEPPGVDLRMFGEFHSEDVEVGYINPGDDTLYYWSTMEISADGTLIMRRHLCESDTDIQEYTWVRQPDDRLQVVPKQTDSDGSFVFLAQSVNSVTLEPGDGCQDIVMFTEPGPSSGLPPSEVRWLPGEVCATPSSNKEKCAFEFTWCEGESAPVCPVE